MQSPMRTSPNGPAASSAGGKPVKIRRFGKCRAFAKTGEHNSHAAADSGSTRLALLGLRERTLR
jgi:hypothetical protein